MDNTQKSIKTFGEYINKVTGKTGYLDKYGGSLVGTFLILLVFFIIFSYYYVITRLKPIKADWLNQRCRPEVIPFAGLINAPPEENKFNFTSKNFMECTNDILSKTIGYFLQPIYYVMNVITNLYAIILKGVQAIRSVMAYVRIRIMGIVSDIFSRILGIMIPIQVMFIKLRDILAKSMGVLTTGLYTVMTAYLSMKSFVGAFLEIIVIGLIILAAATILLWILPFTWPAAAAMTALFVAVATPLAIVALAVGQILAISSNKNIPAKPGCLDKNTRMRLRHRAVRMKNLQVGDILRDGGMVTAKFKIATQNRKMYKLGGMVISGSHKIYYDGMGWIPVKRHPEAKEIREYTEPYIYCINTSSKKFKIRQNLLLDWDDIDDTDLVALKSLASKYLRREAQMNSVHAQLEGGFIGDTKIELEDGRSVCIKDIKVNDHLRFGERVLGIVEIEGKHINRVNRYTFKNTTFVGGPNIWINDKDLGKFSTLLFNPERVTNPDKLYHLLTDTGYLTMDGIRFMDYNSAIEQIMGEVWSNKESLFSS